MELLALKKTPYMIMHGDLHFNREQLTLIRELDNGQFGPVFLAAAKGIVKRGTITEVEVKELTGIVTIHL